ncbi:unnamed protein product, partial [Ectocarpus sp. 12 AP-2014]
FEGVRGNRAVGIKVPTFGPAAFVPMVLLAYDVGEADGGPRPFVGLQPGVEEDSRLQGATFRRIVRCLGARERHGHVAPLLVAKHGAIVQ